jgi:prophage maintenance system killer protein
LILPNLDEVVAINASVRRDDEWFTDDDDLDRVRNIIHGLHTESDPLTAAAFATSRIARSQAFAEGNKRTALLVGRWILDRNGLNGSDIIPKDDHELADLPLRAARGEDMSQEVHDLFNSR